ncbi:TOPRIM nucleotidyl transferase/hydrolase domain-containing protein [Streptomyces sp. NPDC088194]|uniref:TOPRIM nucleotidyl transferase/hydrolase domain-containing protein n=1 Tax=Streptomyces sp. NPDC088194 TaxID=3154931 RepID=UPI00344B6F73
MAGMEEFREAVTAWAAEGAAGAVTGGAPRGAGGDTAERPAGDIAAEWAGRAAVRTVVLVEGPSDVAAVGALAAARGRDLEGEGVCVLAMGGAMSIARFAQLLGPTGLDLRLTGLCDEAERGFYERGFARAGAARQRFFVCAADLEDELIRALGVPRVTELVRAEGDLRALRTFLQQPAQRDRAAPRQLRRFIGTKKGRKIRYGHVLVQALPPDLVPPPLDDLLNSL